MKTKPQSPLRIQSIAAWMALMVLASPAIEALPAVETVFFDVPGDLLGPTVPTPSEQLMDVAGYPDDANRLTLIGQWHLPDPVIHGTGPYPTIVVLHGSGGLWRSDEISKGISSQFRDWRDLLPARGYAVLFVDSYNPRGIAGSFSGRRPHHDPALDDAVCSPNYERPKDIVAALRFIASRPEADGMKVGLLGFSHGSQTGLNAIVDPSVDISPYTTSYVALLPKEPLELVDEDVPEVYVMEEKSISIEVPSPVQIPLDLPFPAVCAFYYPGGAHFGYHGQASSIAAGRYMPDRRTRVLMFHGTKDSLLGVSNPNADPADTPFVGNLFPIKFVLSSGLQAEAEGVANPFVHHLIFDQANHSFDNVTLQESVNWNTPAESADAKAKRLSREEVLKWFDFSLMPTGFQIRPNAFNPAALELTWHGRGNLSYQLLSSPDLNSWSPQGDAMVGADSDILVPVPDHFSERGFFRLEFNTLPPPFNELENTNFFRHYSDFSY